MISDKQLLTLLIGAAIGASGWMHRGNKSPNADSSSFEGLENQLRIAEEEIELLKHENDSLRSLTQGGGEVSVPQELISKIEKDYGLNFISNPVIHRVASEELGYRIEAALESRHGPHGIEDRQEAYQRIGWLAVDDKLLDQLVSVKSVGTLSWFDEQVGEGWVTDRFDLKNIPDQAAMIGLLVRILLNQHFPESVSYPGDDAARAREALHAGAAAGAESRFFSDSARNIGFMPMNENSSAERLMLSLPLFIQGLRTYQVTSGRALADTQYVKGEKAFSEVMRNLPQTTYNLTYPKEEVRGGKMDLPKIDHEIFLTESAGYLGLRLWLEESGDVGMAEELARDWSRDGYLLFADGETSSSLIWDVEFQNETAAEKFTAEANQRVQNMKANTKDRFFSVGRISTKRVRFLNVATAETLTKLAPK
jgi:hypothetical protein